MAGLRQGTAWLNVAAKLAGSGVSFLLYIVLARIMTPVAFADFAVILAWSAIGSSVACLSTPLVLIRYVPEALINGRADLARGATQFLVLATTGLASAIAAVTVALILTGVVSLPRDLPQCALIAAALLVPSVLLLDLAGLLIGLKQAAVAELLVNATRSALTVASVVAFFVVQQHFVSAPLVLSSYLVVSALVAVACVAFTLTILPSEFIREKPAYAIRAWMRTGVGFMVVVVAIAIHERIDIVIMGFLAPSAEVAVYAAAARFAQTVGLAAAAAGTVMAPHLVERLADLRAGRRGDLQELVRNTARTSFFVSLAALAAFAVLGPLLLKLLGPHYAKSYTPLLVLAMGQTISLLFGPGAAVATLAGETRIAVWSLIAGIATNASLSFILVPTLGAIGAALATATGLVCASLVAWTWTLRHFLLNMSVFRVTPR